jgi:hypothetical protein
MTSFFGKYRGEVVNNIDPLLLGRVMVTVPAVFGDARMAWALPCTPLSGNGIGIFTVPRVGAHVWVEFEGGDPDYPILAGGFWTTGEVPGNGLPTTTIIATEAIRITIDDLPGAGGLTLEVGPPAVVTPTKLAMTASGVEITVGASKIVVSLASVSVNDGALEVI